MNKRIKALLIPGALLALFVLGYAANKNRSEDISIGTSETTQELTLFADFPDRKSEAVQDFLVKNLNLTDLTDLRQLEIKHYQTPDRSMRFYIKSTEGSLRISLNKNENDLHALKQGEENSSAVECCANKLIDGHPPGIPL